MPGPEEREEVGVRAKMWVELDSDHLDMVGGFGTDELVGWVREMALRVTHLRLHYTNKALER